MRLTNKISMLLWGAATAVAMTACSDSADPDNTSPKGADPIVPDTEMTAWLNNQTQVDLDVLAAVAQVTERDCNLVFSPLSLRVALAMTANAAGEEAGREVLDFLKAPDTATLNSYISEMLSNFPTLDPKSKLEVANSVWTWDTFDIKDSFSATMADFYKAEAYQYSRYDSEDAVLQRINGWISGKTAGMIPALLNQYSPENSVIALVNAVYYKAPWTDSFDKNLTAKKTFTCADNSRSEVMMMSDPRHTAAYMKNDRMEAVTLGFGNGRFSATFILPAEETDIRSFVASLTPEDINEMTSIRDGMEVDLELPVFDVNASTNMIPVLKKCGISSLFDRSLWTGLTDAGLSMEVSQLLHGARLRIDEEGGEAAAATVVVGDMAAGPPVKPKTFHANRPFFYVITERACGMPLFMGTVEKL